ncbi:hypothetical protein LEMLEM_LOCUS23194 [Lemmus lemmus]
MAFSSFFPLLPLPPPNKSSCFLLWNRMTRCRSGTEALAGSRGECMPNVEHETDSCLECLKEPRFSLVD